MFSLRLSCSLGASAFPLFDLESFLLQVVFLVCYGVRMDFSRRDHQMVQWLVLLVDRVLFEQIQSLEAINQVAEDSEFLVKRDMLAIGDEKL